MKTYLIAGLGNPGSKYHSTRHNAGFLVLEQLAKTLGLSLNKKTKGSICSEISRITQEGKAESQNVLLAQPQEYMNRSGFSIQKLLQFFKIDPSCLLVIHDEVELAFGSMRFKESGGHAGHNGLRNIKNILGKGEFNRLRFGVGRPPKDHDELLHSYVLSNFSNTEMKQLPILLEEATQICLDWLNNQS